jgi:hypothetical protein
MKKQTTLLLIVIALVLSSVACSTTSFSVRTIRGNGDVVEESRDVSSFDEIQLSGIGNLYIEYGDDESLVIEAEENLMRYIETDVTGRKLVIGFDDDNSYQPTEDIDFYLTVVELDGVAISGLGSVNLPEVDTDRFEIKISGAGDVSIDALYAERLEVELSGLGDVDIDGGEVNFQDVRISGSGSYSARRLESSEADVHVSGLGSATVTVEDYLDARISGAGDINYYGSPEIDVDISGLGSLHSMDD